MKIQDLIGEFAISGSNQDDSNKITYKGILKLSLNTNNRIIAQWLIDNEQVQTGLGFFKDNILVINFNYQGENNKIFKGVAVYKCITKDVLDGFWSEEYGDPNYLGTEHCLRLESTERLH